MELKELMEVLDLPAELAEKPIDDAKTVFHTAWVNRNIASEDPDISKKVIGKRMNVLESVLKRAFEFSEDEIKEKKVEDLIELGSKKWRSTVETLKSGATPEVKEWEEKLSKKDKELEKYKRMAQENADKLTEKETEYNGKLKGIKLDTKLEKIRSSIPLSDAATDLAKVGFDSLVKSKYKFELSEDGEEVIVLDQKGERIKNDKNTGFATAEDIFKLEAKANNILKIPGAQRQTGNVHINTTSKENERKLPASVQEKIERFSQKKD